MNWYGAWMLGAHGSGLGGMGGSALDVRTIGLEQHEQLPPRPCAHVSMQQCQPGPRAQSGARDDWLHSGAVLAVSAPSSSVFHCEWPRCCPRLR